jgi:hypothetical protein
MALRSRSARPRGPVGYCVRRESHQCPCSRTVVRLQGWPPSGLSHFMATITKACAACGRPALTGTARRGPHPSGGARAALERDAASVSASSPVTATAARTSTCTASGARPPLDSRSATSMEARPSASPTTNSPLSAPSTTPAADDHDQPLVAGIDSCHAASAFAASVISRSAPPPRTQR